jgi:hypothetical protein
MSEPLTVEALLVQEVELLKGLLQDATLHVRDLETDRAEWEKERRYLVDSLMDLTGAGKSRPQPGEPEKPITEAIAQATGPQRLSWSQVTVGMELKSAARRQQHLKQLSDVARSKRAG